MVSQVPPPEDWKELERYIARFARDFLDDPHAALYGRQGQGQHGLDVLAKDRRPNGSARLWVFQAKNYVTKRLQPADLGKLATLLSGFPDRLDVDTFVVITTAPISTSIQNKAREIGKQLGLSFEVWDWSHFSDLLVRHCGAGPWLAERERARLRRDHCDLVRRELQEAGPLYPLPSNFPGYDVRLEDVFVEPVLRLLPGKRADDGSENLSGKASSVVETPTRYEGRLAEWLSPKASKKPVVLVLAPLGGGKTATLLKAASDLAEIALGDRDAPLPLRVTAKDLDAARLDDVIRRLRTDALPPLWQDPLTTWVILVDALDEVEEHAQHRVLQEIDSLEARGCIAAIAVTCRSSHMHPRMLPAATRLEIPPWREHDWQEFANRWAEAVSRNGLVGAPRASSLVDPSTRSNPLCSTLLIMQESGATEAPPGRAWLFRRLVDGLFRQWAQSRNIDAWESLRRAFERVALRCLANGGRPLSQHEVESAVMPIVGEDRARAIIDAAERQIGLIRRTANDTWDMPFRAVTEYLAAGALMRAKDVTFVRLSGEPWAGEVARLALDRCFEVDTKRALERVCLLLPPTEDETSTLRRTLVAAQAARDRVKESTPIALLVAFRLAELATDESSEWRRRRVGEEIRRFALDGGPVWDALWPMLEPLLSTGGSRTRWFAEYGEGDADFWADRLFEQNASVRAVATARLGAWKDQPEIEELLLWQLRDEGYASGEDEWTRPALWAASALRDVPHDDEMKALLSMDLESDEWLTSEAAAVALLPGEANTALLLQRLRDAFHHGPILPPAVYRALAALRELPEGKAWLEQHWPEGAKDDFGPSARVVSPFMPPPRPDAPPPSREVRNDLFWSIAPALRRPDIRDAVGRNPFHYELSQVLCSIAELAPEAAVERLESGAVFFLQPGAQDALGRAALLHPEVARALIKRWDGGVDSSVPSRFPGLALDALAARGDEDAIRVYAAWLPSNPFTKPLVPNWRPPSRAALEQPAIREAALSAVNDAWGYATRGKMDENGAFTKLHPNALSLALRSLWPAWEENRELRADLIARASAGEPEWFDVALQAWMEGEFPTEIADLLAHRLTTDWPPDPLFAYIDLPIWLGAAKRAKILPKIEPVLVRLVEPDFPSFLAHQAASYLILLHPTDAAAWARRAAEKTPFLAEDRFRLQPDDESRLIAADPEAWAGACLEAVRGAEVIYGVRFLRMTHRLWQRLEPSPLRDELARVSRELAQYDFPWVSVGLLSPCVRMGDLAEELLFIMGASLPRP